MWLSRQKNIERRFSKVPILFKFFQNSCVLWHLQFKRVESYYPPFHVNWCRSNACHIGCLNSNFWSWKRERIYYWTPFLILTQNCLLVFYWIFCPVLCVSWYKNVLYWLVILPKDHSLLQVIFWVSLGRWIKLFFTRWYVVQCDLGFFALRCQICCYN